MDLSTRLTDIGYDGLCAVPDSLIDTAVIGQDWGLAMDRCLRANPDATLGDLRDELLSEADGS